MNAQLETFQPEAKYLLVVEKGQKPERIHPKNAVVAEVGTHIVFNPTILDTFDVKGCQPLHYDLMVLSAAIEFADRRWKRPHRWSRSFQITIPVTDLAAWNRPDVLKSLRAALRLLTLDDWHFKFVQSKNRSPIGARQSEMSIQHAKTFAMAYSDGLDSRAVAALSGNKDEGLCIRVANNRPRRKGGDSYFAPIPFRVKGHRSQESSFRSRGFQFTALTAVAAQLSNVSRIVVPESGQGALGTVLLPLHNIHPDYRNHPVFLRKMERFIGAFLGFQAFFDQPRLWFTKGQTLRAFLALSGKKKEDLTSAHSCWQKRRVVNVGVRKHCGLCAACLLRRMSMHAAKIEEALGTYVISDLSKPTVQEALSVLSSKSDRNVMAEYASVGVRHFQHLADLAGFRDGELRQHACELAAATGMSEEETLTKLRKLLVIHAQEWRAFLAAQGEQSFLMGWMDGGRHV